MSVPHCHMVSLPGLHAFLWALSRLLGNTEGQGLRCLLCFRRTIFSLQSKENRGNLSNLGCHQILKRGSPPTRQKPLQDLPPLLKGHPHRKGAPVRKCHKVTLQYFAAFAHNLTTLCNILRPVFRAILHVRPMRGSIHSHCQVPYPGYGCQAPAIIRQAENNKRGA